MDTDEIITFESIQAKFEAGFRPASHVVNYAAAYARNRSLDSVIVPVNFPGKKRGLWFEDQPRENIMEGSFPVVFTVRDAALAALDSGVAGNTLFRVYADGQVTLVDEK